MLTFQNLEIPIAYITALSYSKRARTHTTSRGFAQFLGFDAAEISLRVEVSYARATAAGRDFDEDLGKLLSLEVAVDSIPTQVVLAGHILYPSLEFRATSITRTIAADHNGAPYACEADITLSGVSVTKAETGRRALTLDEDATLPTVTITCKGASLEVGAEVAVSRLELHPDRLDAEFLIGDDSKIVEDAPWLIDLVQNEASISVGDYGSFYIVSASLVDGVLTVGASIWKKQNQLIMTFRNQPLGGILKTIYPQSRASVTGDVGYYLATGSALDCIRQLQSSAGFLIDYRNGVHFVDVPSAIVPGEGANLYIDEDLATEEITGLIWKDTKATYTAGTNPTVTVQSAFTASDGYAERCLSYYRYMQNSITLTTAIDPRIRHHSAIGISKDAQIIPCMVEDYVIDFVGGVMTVDCHYVDRKLS